MNFQKLKSDSYWVGGRHRSSTKPFIVKIPLKVVKY